MNDENLKPIRDPEMARALQEKSVAARKRNSARAKTMKEWAKVIGRESFDITLPDGSLLKSDLNGATVVAAYKSAMKGNVKAAQFLAKLRGELDEQVSIDVSGSKKKGNRPVLIQFVDAGDDGCGQDK